MAVTLRLQTNFGPYRPGSVFVTTPFHARRLLEAYDDRVQVVDRFGRPTRIYDGITAYIREASIPEPDPRSDTILITFRTTINRFQSGVTYRLRVNAVERFLRNNPRVALYYGNRRVTADQVQVYADAGVRLYADQEFRVYSA